MVFDWHDYPYPSRRTLVAARRGMVATAQHLAAQAGLRILMEGGNAVDAAVATAACLTVVEPTSNGIGSDAFAIVHVGGELFGLNASGPAPHDISSAAVRARGHDRMPAYGVLPITVPGAPAAWAALSERFGRMPLAQALRPAIEYARNGYAVSPDLARFWAAGAQAYGARREDPVFTPWLQTFAPAGRAPYPGELWRSPGHADTLEAIAQTGARTFYEGELADRIVACVGEHGGFMTKDDLAAFVPEWVNPIHVHYRGYDVWELPPNGQGIVALIALGILAHLDLGRMSEDVARHVAIEAIKLAFADGREHITDPRFMRTTVAELLDKDRLQALAAGIGARAHTPRPADPHAGGTVYLATADGEGNMVSYIQSNYTGFGSGVVVPGTGIALQNRGLSFSLDDAHANALVGGKRPYHTIIPGFLTQAGTAIGPFGVMGGYMQPQGHLQVITNIVDRALNPQAALDAPRWQWEGDRRLAIESGFGDAVAQRLAAVGHQVLIHPQGGHFGRGQMIWRTPDGTLAGATEGRADSCVAAW